MNSSCDYGSPRKMPEERLPRVLASIGLQRGSSLFSVIPIPRLLWLIYIWAYFKAIPSMGHQCWLMGAPCTFESLKGLCSCFKMKRVSLAFLIDDHGSELYVGIPSPGYALCVESLLDKILEDTPSVLLKSSIYTSGYFPRGVQKLNMPERNTLSRVNIFGILYKV